MKIYKLTFLLLVVSFALSIAQTQSYNYEEMEEEQYLAYLQEWQDRLAAANTGIAEQDAKIAELQTELDDVNAQIAANWDEIYAKAGSDKSGNDAFMGEINQLKGDVNALSSLSAEDIYGRMNELDELQARIDALEKNDLSTLSANEKLLGQVQSLIDQAREKGKAAVPPSYTVMRGDYLWRIASKEDIYGDAYAWMRIYTSNTDQIKDPDLIYPNQVFSIPRVVGPNEYLVKKGESLSSIAGSSSVYGSSFQWQKLHETNKNAIADPNVIYPYQVLKISR